jgi:signal transduction histidine kinase
VEAIYRIPLFDEVTEDEFDWLKANSHEVTLQPGEFYFHENQPVRNFYVVLEGEMQITRTIGGKLTVMGTTTRGSIGGEISLLNGTPSDVSTCALVPTRLLVFDRPTFRAIFAQAPTVGARVLKTAVRRMAGVVSLAKQQEKMAALGKLAAGLAHELNNPATAARRAAVSLRDMLIDLETQTLGLRHLGLTDEQLQGLITTQRDAIRSRAALNLSPLESSDRESEIADWLDRLGVPRGWEMAASFVQTGVTMVQLEALVQKLNLPSPNDLLIWLCNALTVAGLLDEIDQSTRRISSLIDTVRGYTYMDEAPVQEIDVHAGLENTLSVLRPKLERMTIVREFDPTLPKIMAYGQELNQVWTNLIVNAVDATDGKGTLRIVTRNEIEFVMVEFADNGKGIPPEFLSRIFEPFFTTKSTTLNSGLGLDVSYRIIQLHGGSMDVESEPGRTRFIIRLPVQGV